MNTEETEVRQEAVPVSKNQAYQNLANAVLSKMFIDLERGYFDEDFLLSEWFNDLCYLARVSSLKIKEEAYRRYKAMPYCKIGSPPMTAY